MQLIILNLLVRINPPPTVYMQTCKSDERTWKIEGLITLLSDIVINNVLELTDSTYKVKETQIR